MIKIINVCSECADVITEPLCVSCFENQVFSWMREQEFYDDTYKEVEFILDSARMLSLSDTKCIICSQEMHNICNYCVMKEVVETIKKHPSAMSIDPITIFNYHIYHSGLQRQNGVQKWS